MMTAAAAPKAPILDASGNRAKDLTLEASVFGAEIKPHLVHERGRRARPTGRGAVSRFLPSRGASRSRSTRKSDALRYAPRFRTTPERGLSGSYPTTRSRSRLRGPPPA
jgi:hypothetical protein